MDRLTRHELKSDKFVEEVGQTVHFFEEHRRQLIRYTGIALVAIVIAVAAYYSMRVKRTERQAALQAVIEVYNAPIIDPVPEAFKAFRNEDDRSVAIVKECNGLIAKYGGSEEAAIASYLLGLQSADRGDFAKSERYLTQASKDAGKEYASLAQFALAQLYLSQGKTAEAERQFRNLIDHPTVLVTREQATISLAHLFLKSRPEEARKLVAPLQSVPGAVGRAAMSVILDLNQTKR